jgi:hypothetical protein
VHSQTFLDLSDAKMGEKTDHKDYDRKEGLEDHQEVVLLGCCHVAEIGALKIEDRFDRSHDHSSNVDQLQEKLGLA